MSVLVDCIVASVIVGILNHILIPKLMEWDKKPQEIEEDVSFMHYTQFPYCC